MCQRESSSLGHSLHGNEPLASIRNGKFLITWATIAVQGVNANPNRWFVNSEKNEQGIITSTREQKTAVMAIYYVDAVHTDNA